MKRILTVIAVLCFFISPQSFAQKTILGIWAHPDDENVIGQVFSKYAAMGYKVYVVIATDGKDGTRVTTIPAGDSLGNLRQEETKCACKALGIEPPVFLHIDRLDTRIGTGNYLREYAKALKKVKEQIEKLQPDILITWGPDGEYGHSEHIVIGSIVTDLLMREGWVEKYPLYFPIEKEKTPQGENGYAKEKYLNTTISYSDADKQRCIEAGKCYVTQYTPEEIQELIKFETADKENKKYFRRFAVAKSKSTTF